MNQRKILLSSILVCFPHHNVLAAIGMYILSSDAAQKVTGYGKTKWTQNYSLDIGRAFHNETRLDISKDRLNHNLNYINQFLRGKKNESSDDSKQVYQLDTQNFIKFIITEKEKIYWKHLSSVYFGVAVTL